MYELTKLWELCFIQRLINTKLGLHSENDCFKKNSTVKLVEDGLTVFLASSVS